MRTSGVMHVLPPTLRRSRAPVNSYGLVFGNASLTAWSVMDTSRRCIAESSVCCCLSASTAFSAKAFISATLSARGMISPAVCGGQKTATTGKAQQLHQENR